VTPAGEHGVPVSWDTYNIWTLFTPFQGQHGFGRLSYPDFQRTPFTPVTYATGADILFSLVLVTIIALLFFGRQKPLFLFLTTILLAFVVLGTRTQGRYYTLAIPFLVISYLSIIPVSFWIIWGITTSISLVTMYGSLMSFNPDNGLLSFLLDPDRNQLAAAVQRGYGNDLFITIFSIMAVVTLIYCLLLSCRASTSIEHHPGV
jgi:hypothetical protein